MKRRTHALLGVLCGMGLLHLGCSDDDDGARVHEAGADAAAHAGDGRGTGDADASRDASGNAGAAASGGSRAPDATTSADAAFDASADAENGDANDRDTAAHDAAADGAVPDPACTGEARDPDGAPPEETETLLLELPAAAPVGKPFVLAITSPSGLSGPAIVCIDAQLVARAQLYHGRGSATLELAHATAVELVVRAGTAFTARTLDATTRAERPLSGALQGDDLIWTDDADVVLSGDVQVTAGSRLSVGPGVRVFAGTNAGLEVAGELVVEGSADAPVLFTREGTDAWGGIHVVAGGNASLQHAWFTGGGGDASRPFGHSNSQPVVLVEQGELELSGGGIVDNPGKALGSSEAHLTARDILLSRCDTGGQLSSSAILIERAFVLEIPDADGVIADDDNDALYFSSPLMDENGAPILSVIRDSVLAVGEDDGIDHNNAELRVERVWIEGFHHEGVAASSGNTITVVDTVVRNCDQGIEAGYGAPQVHVEHCLLTDNGVGLRVGDSYDRATSGSLTVRNTVAYANQTNVLNYVNQIHGPLDGALDIACSLVDDPAYDTLAGNLPAPPTGDYVTAGCISGPAAMAPECSDATLGPTACFW